MNADLGALFRADVEEMKQANTQSHQATVVHGKAGLVWGLYALTLAAQLQLAVRVVLASVADEENEGYMLIGQGIPTLCGFGPEGGNAHAPDEYVVLESLALTTAIYAGIAQDVLQKGGGTA